MALLFGSNKKANVEIRFTGEEIRDLVIAIDQMYNLIKNIHRQEISSRSREVLIAVTNASSAVRKLSDKRVHSLSEEGSILRKIGDFFAIVGEFVIVSNHTQEIIDLANFLRYAAKLLDDAIKRAIYLELEFMRRMEIIKNRTEGLMDRWDAAA